MTSETPATIEALLEAGANLAARDARGLTPRDTAASRSRVPWIIDVLVAAGADPNADGAGWTPIHMAAVSNDSPANIEALVAGGADIHVRDDEGRTPLHLTARYGDAPEVITALAVAGADVDARDSGKGGGLTPLHAAILHNDRPEIIEALLTSGADVDALHLGSTPLHLAAADTEPSTIEALLEAGADPTAVDEDGNTPGDLAVDRGEIRSHAVFWRHERCQVPGGTLPRGASTTIAAGRRDVVRGPGRYSRNRVTVAVRSSTKRSASEISGSRACLSCRLRRFQSHHGPHYTRCVHR